MMLSAEKTEIRLGEPDYPASFKKLAEPPEKIYVMGNPSALREGLGAIGARKATPYGLSAAKHFVSLAAQRGITIVSGGARGCDAASHWAALEAGENTVAFLGGGLNHWYPMQNKKLFQAILESGGALVSEIAWDEHPLPHYFRMRNRLIAALSRALLIVEAGLPSGTFSTADEALNLGKEVLVVPGSISSPQSMGSNRLLYQGAIPIVDDESFLDQLFLIFGSLIQEDLVSKTKCTDNGLEDEWGLYEALRARPMSMEEMHAFISCKDKNVNAATALMVWLAKAGRDGYIAQYPDGHYGPLAAR